MHEDNLRYRLFRGSFSIDKHIVLRNGNPVAILVPGVLFAFDDAGGYVAGPRGTARFHDTAFEDIWAALIAVDGILLGKPDEILSVSALLSNPETSRSFSYITCIAKDCQESLTAFNRFCKSRVVILGCGGIGSLSAVLLAGAGLTNLRLVDCDNVEISNLNRQLFFTLESVGRPKVDVLHQEIRKRFPVVTVEGINVLATRDNMELLCKECDAILVTADEPIGLVQWAQDFAKRLDIHLVLAGYSTEQGLVSSCKEANLKMVWVRGPQSIMPSFGPTNAELAGVATTLLFQLLSGFTKNFSGGQTYGWQGHRFPRKYISLIDRGMQMMGLD